MKQFGVVCIFSEDSDLLFEQTIRLRDKGYLVFATPNIYKFVRYAKELQPDLIIVDMDASAMRDSHVLEYLRNYKRLTDKPILMVGKHFNHCYVGIAHYATKPYVLKALDEIVESYCRGNKKHDVLLVDECINADGKIKKAILEQNLSCFEIADTNAACYYLKKNNPRCICINLPYDKCVEAEQKLKHNKIFFVENYKQLKNLSRLI